MFEFWNVNFVIGISMWGMSYGSAQTVHILFWSLLKTDAAKSTATTASTLRASFDE